MEKRYLVTGCSGFIGFHLCKSLLEDNCKVYGLDNLNNYYDINLKIDRNRILNNYPNFKFFETNIEDKKKLTQVFKMIKPQIVVNLAAQAGVRYSLKNPELYINSNIVGFLNVIECSKEFAVDSFIYASSSSVYGKTSKVSFSEKDSTDRQVSIYGVTKKSNELIAHAYSHLYGLNTTGLRFFTVYGEYGRPDMAYYNFTKKIINKDFIQIYNNGNMKRDFTYIDDIIIGIRSAINYNYRYEIFNLGNNQSEDLMKLVRLIEFNLGIKAHIKFLPMQSGDVITTHADIEYSRKMLDFNPNTSLETGMKKFINWVGDNMSYFLESNKGI